jgi:phosphoribosyl 1,2-cyclic phosphodiesterase
MQARIWGCRGSLATPGAKTIEYGGNTSCVEIRLADGTLVVLDAGTGIRELGVILGRERGQKIHLCLTHLHLDHIEGLGFFAPIWQADTELHVWGPPSALRSIEERVARYFSPPLFPMQLSDVPARTVFHDVPAEPWTIGSARLMAERVFHPGPTLGYRIEENGRALAYIPDHEPALGLQLDALSSDWISGFGLAREADVLLHDSQYSEEEYPSRVGWGHSSIADSVLFAGIAEARRLVLFHHDPLHADGELETLRERACELWGESGEPPTLAHEGMELAL